MEQFEKVEKLRQRANVTYEEAKSALEACDWDLLDAMVYLEKLGKVKSPEQPVFSTTYEAQSQFGSVQDTVKKQKATSEGFWEKVGRLCKKLLKKSKENYFCVDRRGESVFKMPVWAFVLIVLVGWQIVLPAMIIALFFECQYSFHGKDDLSSANQVMEKASKLADKVKDEFERL